MALLLVVACGYPRAEWEFERELNRADRLRDAEQWEDARELYWKLAYEAPSAERLRYIRFRLAQLEELRGAHDEALAAYGEIAAEPVGNYDQYAGRAAYRIARIVREQHGEGTAWVEALQSVVLTFPQTTAANDALEDLKLFAWRSGEEIAFVEWLAAMEPVLGATEIGDNLVYFRARTLAERLDRPEEAYALYRYIAEEYRSGPLWDDAVWRGAEALRSMGRIDEEERVLQHFIDGREESWFMTDYDSRYYGQTLLRLCEIAREAGRIEDAIAQLERYRVIYPLSLRNDDLGWEIAQMQRSIGDEAGLRRTLAWLEEHHPESRFTRRTADLVAAGGAP